MSRTRSLVHIFTQIMKLKLDKNEFLSKKLKVKLHYPKNEVGNNADEIARGWKKKLLRMRSYDAFFIYLRFNLILCKFNSVDVRSVLPIKIKYLAIHKWKECENRNTTQTYIYHKARGWAF